MSTSSLRILEAVPEVFMTNIPGLVQIIGATLSSPSVGVDDKLQGVKALVSVILCAEDEEEEGNMKGALKQFQELINGTPTLIHGFITSGDEEAIVEVLNCYAELVDGVPKLFKNCFGILVQGLSTMVIDSSAGQGEEVRAAGLEFLMTLIESLPAKIKKDRAALDQVVMLLLKVVAEIPEESSTWYAANPDDEDDDEGGEEQLSMYGEQYLDRLSMALGGRVLAAPFFAVIPQMTSSQADWRHRYAGLKAIASIAEGCLDELEDRMEALLALVWPGFTDPHPRVQYAASHALGQLCTDFAGSIQANQEMSRRALTCLVGILVGGSNQPRVQAHAAAALINFSEGVEAEVLNPYLDEIVGALVGFLERTEVLYLRSQVIATIAAFASAAGPTFSKYYQAIVPPLMALLEEGVRAHSSDIDRAVRSIQCRALEAVSLIFYSIGWDLVPKDNLEILVTLMMVLQKQVSEADDNDADEMGDFLTMAWTRLAQVMGEHFAPLLPVVLPPMLEKAAQEPDMAILDAGDSLEAYDQDDWEFATLKGKRLGIRTSTLEAKLVALEHLTSFVNGLGKAFLPMVPQTVRVALPLLEFDLHEGIQGAAAGLLASLLALMPPGAERMQFAVATIQGLLGSFAKYYHPDYTYAALDALADILAIEGIASELPEGSATALFQDLSQLLTILSKAIMEKQQKADADDDDEDEDEEDEIDEIEDVEGVCYALSRFMSAVYEAFPPQQTLPHSSDLLHFCRSLVLSPAQGTSSLRHAGLCIIDDLLKGTQGLTSSSPALCTAIIDIFSWTIKQIAAGKEEDTDVVQSVAFGLGMMAEFGGPSYADFLGQQGLPFLVALLSAANARAPSRMDVTDNAASAFGRIALAMPSPAVAQAVPAWIRAFPVLSDEQEIVPAYRALAMLVQNQPAWFDRSRLSEAIAPVLLSDSLDQEADLKTALQQLVAQL
jgi:hypothetical protein